MQKITIQDLQPVDDYNRNRDQYRERLYAIKEPRRVRLGDYLTFLFENRDTMLYQVQEMVRAEGLREEAAIQHEIDTYNAMIPDPFQFKVTLLIEFDDPVVREVKLRELLGLEDHVSMLIDRDYQIQAEFDPTQIDADRKVSSVQFLTFNLGEKAGQAFMETDQVELLTTHPACSYRVTLTAEQREALADDLRAALK